MPTPRQGFRSLPALAAAHCLVFSLGAPAARAEAGQILGPDGKPLLVAKKKKKKKKAEDDGDFGPPEIAAIEGDQDSGVGVHREQEGVDTPYKMEIQGQGDIASVTRKVGKGDAVSETQVNIASGGGFILGKMEIGGELAIDYSSGETDAPVVASDGTVSTEKAEVSTYGVNIGPLFKFNFGKIDTALLLPFVQVSLGYRMAATTIGEADPLKSSGYYAKVGGGINIFLDSNVAINPGLQYRIVSDKTEPKDGDPVENSESGIHFLGGFAIFL